MDSQKVENYHFRHSGERWNPVYSICSGCPRIEYGAGLIEFGMTFLDFLRRRQVLHGVYFWGMSFVENAAENLSTLY